ncbi:MAG: hypothetical protein ACLS89_10565 [Collinsella sp.]
MDGTLVDTERLGIKAWKAGADWGAIDEALIHQFIGRTPDVMDILDKHYGSHEPPGGLCPPPEIRDEMVKTELELGRRRRVHRRAAGCGLSRGSSDVVPRYGRAQPRWSDSLTSLKR